MDYFLSTSVKNIVEISTIIIISISPKTFGWYSVLYRFWLKLPVFVGVVVLPVATLTVLPPVWPCSKVFWPNPDPKENSNITTVKIIIQVNIELFFANAPVIDSLLTPNILTANKIKKIISISIVNHGVKLWITDTTPDDIETKNAIITAIMACRLFLSSPSALTVSIIA